MSSEPEDAPVVTGRTAVEDVEMNRGFNVNEAATVEYMRSDYEEAWFAIVWEKLQNAFDSWLEKRGELIPEDRELVVSFLILPEEGVIKLWDNAGGMTEAVLEGSYLAINQTSQQKQDGGHGGAYGRGTCAMLETAERFRVETLHPTDGRHIRSGVPGDSTKNEDPRYGMVENPDERMMDTEGTVLQLSDVHKEVMDDVTDWDAFKETVLKKFIFMLQHPDVTVQYRCGRDDKPKEVTAPDLSQMREQGMVEVVEELPATTKYDGDTKMVMHARNLVLIDARELDREAPWKGIRMVKGHEDYDQPYMQIKDYAPTVPAIQSEELFGWVDITEFCPEYEDMAHDGIHRVTGKEMGIKKVVERVQREHFRKQDDESGMDSAVREGIMNRLNEKFSHRKELENYESGEMDTDEGDGSSRKKKTQKEPDWIVCRGRGREYGSESSVEYPAAEEVAGEHEVELCAYIPKDDVDCSRLVVPEVVLRDLETGDEEVVKTNLVFDDLGESGEKKSIPVGELSDGRYTVSAEVKQHPGVSDLEHGLQSEPAVDSSNVSFVVGDAEFPESEDEGDSGGGVQLEDVTKTGMPIDLRTSVDSVGDGDFHLWINTNHDDWKATFDEAVNEQNRQELQIEYGVKWGADAIVEHLLQKEVAEMTQGMTTEDGEPLNEKLAGRVEELIKLRHKTREGDLA